MSENVPTTVPLNEWQVKKKRLPTYTFDERGKLSNGERVVKQRCM